MNAQRFQDLAGAYGGDIARWPADERLAASAFLDATPAAGAWLEEAGALDLLLNQASSPAPGGFVRERIISGAPRPQRPLWRQSGAWISGAGLAAACLLGIFAGANVPSSYLNDPATEAAASIPTVFDGTAYYDVLETEG